MNGPRRIRLRRQSFDSVCASLEIVEAVPVVYVNDLVEEEHADWLLLASDPPHDPES